MVFNTFIGNGDEVDLRTKTVGQNYTIDDILFPKQNPMQNPMENPAVYRTMSVFFTILAPLCVIMFICIIKTFVSTYIIYFVVDGGIYGAWEYFKPFFTGVVQFFITLGETFDDIDQLGQYLENILISSVSWQAMFSFDYSFDTFKYSVFFGRTLLYLSIGIIDTIANTQ